MSIRFQACAVLCAASVLAATGAVVYTAFAGPLTPPAGPVTGTYKTLSEVEPRIAINATNTAGDADSLFKITQPGSYYLTGNITGVAGKHGIEIVSSGVTVDLSGFDLVGVPAMGAFDGVSVTAFGLSNIAVLNGSVRNWGDEGVDLASSNVVNGRVEGVRANGNASTGIGVGLGSTVSNCSASGNGGLGIFAGAGSAISSCSAYSNTGSGISTNGACTISNCTAYQNTGSGISVATGCTVSGSAAIDNAINGVLTSSGCTVSNCSAFSNTAAGIAVGFGSTVVECVSRSNTLDGILCNTACVIRGNTCSSNGSGTGDGAGIHAAGNDSRIEGNNCSSADRGIDVDLAGNIIIRNTCSGNTLNWVIAANNYYGPIIDRAGIATAAVSGSAAAGTLASTDANANFSY